MKKNLENYTAKDIQSKSPLDAIRENPGTYIGKLHPGRLLEEVLNNALDEIISGFGNIVNIKITEDNYVEVIDNGRGIPLDNDSEGVPMPITVSTLTNTSGKFKSNETKKYHCSSGLNGWGLKIVNALSKELVLMINRPNQSGIFVFKEGICQEHKIIDRKNSTTGTKVKFLPDDRFFKNFDYSTDEIVLKLKVAMACFPGLKCFINIKDKEVFNLPDITVKEIFDFAYQGTMTNPIFDAEKVIEIVHKETDEKMVIYWNYDLDKKDSKINSYINLISVKSGTHIDFIKNKFADAIRKKFTAAQQKGLETNDFLAGLRCLIILFMNDSRFEANKKDELITDEHEFQKFESLLDKSLNKIIKEISASDIETLVTKIQMTKAGANVKIKKKKDGKGSDKGKLVPCLKNKNNILFLVEGDSAMGSMKNARNKDYHALFPLGGKILNVENKSVVTIIENKEIFSLVSTIGLLAVEKNKLVKTGKINYSQIVILTDADIDGKHIALLLCRLFKTIMPEIIEEGKLFVAKMPLYGYFVGKEFIPVYTQEDAEKIMQEGKHKLNRYKGLGQMDAITELRPTIIGKHKQWIKITK